MKKKKGGGGGANWMDTYGDMVTLLLCFFVLLYSMSTISEDKWKAIVQSFNPMAVQAMTDPNGVGGPYADPEIGDGEPGLTDPSELELSQDAIENMIEQLAQAINDMVAEEGLESVIQVEMQGGKVYVKFSDTVFFDADSPTLKRGAEEVLSKVCTILDTAKDAIEEIRIQGHTAQGSANVRNEPRNDRRLAGNRAIEVALFIQQNSSIHPARLIPEAYGQWHPISSNATGTLRAFNRRVEMIISGRDLDEEALGNAIQTYISQDNADMGIEE